MDLQLIKACLDKRTYEILQSKIPHDIVGGSTSTMLRWVGAYYKSNPSAGYLTPEYLKAYIQLRLKDQDTEGLRLLLQLCDKLKATPSPEVPTILNMLLERDFVGRVGALYVRYEHGDEVDFYTEVEQLVKQYHKLRHLNDVPDYDIHTLLDEMQQGRGIKLSGLADIHQHVDNIPGGASIAFAARPGQGKSSWLAYTLTRSAKSIYEYFGGRGVMFAVNEGDPGRVMPRMYQAALGATLSELYALRDSGDLIEAYEQATGVPADFITPVPIAGWSFSDLEREIESRNPGVVVIDMLEHVALPGNLSKAELTAQQWVSARELALLYDYVSIATVQIGFDGANTMYPTYDHLNYSKTGIQSATDVVITMGSLTDVQYQELRGFSVQKNKFTVEGSPEKFDFQASFDKDRALFNDGAVTTQEITNA